jgi:hypothetical protein
VQKCLLDDRQTSRNPSVETAEDASDIGVAKHAQRHHSDCTAVTRRANRDDRSGIINGSDGNYYVEKDQQYTIPQFGGFPWIVPTRLNDSDEVVGWMDNLEPTNWIIKGFYLKKGEAITALEYSADRPLNYAMDINNQGFIVGYSVKQANNGLNYSHAERWVNMVFDPLGLPFVHSEAMAINDSGKIAFHAGNIYIWKDGNYSIVALPGPISYSHVVALNDAGDLLATSLMNYSDRERQPTEPMIHTQDGSYMLNCAVHPENGWRVNQVFDLNNPGQIVGTIQRETGGQSVGIVLSPPSVTPPQLPHTSFLPFIRR